MENKRVVINRVIENVRSAYWRAVSAERLLAAMDQLKEEIDDAFLESETLLERKKVAPMKALTDQRDLLSSQEDISGLQKELTVAKHQLASLMNLDPGVEFSIALPDRHEINIPKELDVEKMLNIALVNRPELRELSYKERINDQEAKIALLKLLPGFRIQGNYGHEDSDFLLNQDWTNWGAKTSWNLLEAFRYPAKKRSIEATDKLLETQALALTMAVMTQVHVSRTRLAFAEKSLENAERFRSVQHKIQQQIRAAYNAGRISRHSFLKERLNTLLAEIKHDIAVASAQNAFANIYASMGIDSFSPSLNGDEALDDMTESLRLFWLERGDLHIKGGQKSGLVKSSTQPSIKTTQGNSYDIPGTYNSRSTLLTDNVHR